MSAGGSDDVTDEDRERAHLWVEEHGDRVGTIWNDEVGGYVREDAVSLAAQFAEARRAGERATWEKAADMWHERVLLLRDEADAGSNARIAELTEARQRAQTELQRAIGSRLEGESFEETVAAVVAIAQDRERRIDALEEARQKAEAENAEAVAALVTSWQAFLVAQAKKRQCQLKALRAQMGEVGEIRYARLVDLSDRLRSAEAALMLDSRCDECAGARQHGVHDTPCRDCDGSGLGPASRAHFAKYKPAPPHTGASTWPLTAEDSPEGPPQQGGDL
jgi:hypothetical protein